MKGFNQVTLMGNLTREPETRTTPNGSSVTSFSLAVNSKFGDKERVDYFDCNAWGKTGEIIAQYTTKGSSLLVGGRLEQRTWEKDGEKRSKVEINVQDFNFIGSKEVVTDTQSGYEKAKEARGSLSDSSEISMSDIPF